MSAFKSYIALCDYLAVALQPLGLAVVMDRAQSVAAPYLRLDESTQQVDGWMTKSLVAGALQVDKIANESVAVTTGKLIDGIKQAIADSGSLLTYDYTVSATIPVGQVTPTIRTVSGEMDDGEDSSRRVIVFLLVSNTI